MHILGVGWFCRAGPEGLPCVVADRDGNLSGGRQHKSAPNFVSPVPGRAGGWREMPVFDGRSRPQISVCRGLPSARYARPSDRWVVEPSGTATRHGVHRCELTGSSRS